MTNSELLLCIVLAASVVSWMIVRSARKTFNEDFEEEYKPGEND